MKSVFLGLILLIVVGCQTDSIAKYGLVFLSGDFVFIKESCTEFNEQIKFFHLDRKGIVKNYARLMSHDSIFYFVELDEDHVYSYPADCLILEQILEEETMRRLIRLSKKYKAHL